MKFFRYQTKSINSRKEKYAFSSRKTRFQKKSRKRALERTNGEIFLLPNTLVIFVLAYQRLIEILRVIGVRK